jgi:periplasmic protein TonB
METGSLNRCTPSDFSPAIVSALVHGVVFVTLIYAGRTYVAPMLLPGDANGTRLTLTYLPGRAAQPATLRAADSQVPAPTAADAKLSDPHLIAPQQAATSHDAAQKTAPPSTTNVESPNPDSLTGADSLGTGNINIAYLDSFRSPRPDLSSLPRGVAGDVILDVTIDAAGRIIALKKLSGVGYGIDESVIATVQAWVFHPATKDGTPVVSEQELHFHYERRNG